MSKEAQARIKINKLLEAAGWRFFDDEHGKANIALEPNARLTQAQADAMGNDFETSKTGQRQPRTDPLHRGQGSGCG